MISRRGLMAGAAGAAVAGVLGGKAAAQAASGAYVMAYFTESPSMTGADYGLHLAVSTDGLDWMPLNQNNPVVTPTAGTGGLRDPFVLRKQDGRFVVLATDLKGTDWSLQNQYVHVWDSADLRGFTGYRRIKLHSMATHSWAPEACITRRMTALVRFPIPGRTPPIRFMIFSASAAVIRLAERCPCCFASGSSKSGCRLVSGSFNASNDGGCGLNNAASRHR